MMRSIDYVINDVTRQVPTAEVSQIHVKYPCTGDDGIWIFRLTKYKREIQNESCNGEVPFIIETDSMKTSKQAYKTSSVEETAQAIIAYLTSWGSDNVGPAMGPSSVDDIKTVTCRFLIAMASIL